MNKSRVLNKLLIIYIIVETDKMSKKFDYDSWQAKMIALEIANEVGRAILKSLAEDPKTASQLSRTLEIPLPTILFHISRLEESEIVDSKKVLVITNRKEAINAACALAQNGDIILVAGKGHEKYQEIKGVKHPFDDKQLLEEILTKTE